MASPGCFLLWECLHRLCLCSPHPPPQSLLFRNNLRPVAQIKRKEGRKGRKGKKQSFLDGATVRDRQLGYALCLRMLTASLICPHGNICKTSEVRTQQRELWEFREAHMGTRAGGWGASYWRWISADLLDDRLSGPPRREVLCSPSPGSSVFHA